MKIAVVQFRSISGDVEQNIQRHLYWTRRSEADAVFFPELSLTNYEPQLAKQLQLSIDDSRLTVFQQLSNEENKTIGIGAPLRTDFGTQIAMLVFQPHQFLRVYAKQYLHEDEKPYFIAGKRSVTFAVDKTKIAPAICYESLQEAHIKKSVQLGAQIYLASVAKSAAGLAKAMCYFPIAAKKYKLPILMSNSIGDCDDFESVGGSAIWNDKGELVAQLNCNNEGVLVYDFDLCKPFTHKE